MNQIEGIVEKAYKNPVNGGHTQHKVIIDGGSYTRLHNPIGEVGDRVSLVFESKGQYNNVTKDGYTLIMKNAGGQNSGPAANSNAGQDRQASIQRQTAVKAAATYWASRSEPVDADAIIDTARKFEDYFNGTEEQDEFDPFLPT